MNLPGLYFIKTGVFMQNSWYLDTHTHKKSLSGNKISSNLCFTSSNWKRYYREVFHRKPIDPQDTL